MSRPPYAIVPGEGQESVWDYPRPPRLEPVSARIIARFGGVTIADTTAAYRVLETSHPPVYYLPPGDIAPGVIEPVSGTSFCEFKGVATYVTIAAGGRRAERAGWRYQNPTGAFTPIAGFIAFYASKLDEALVGGEQVDSQEGDFYGGWITSHIVGPFKGAPGTLGW
jgi:uncharacterized protein (DUF427 family)